MDNPNGTISLMVGDGVTSVNSLTDLLKDNSIRAGAMVNNDDVLIL